jgi:hypothetical protein
MLQLDCGPRTVASACLITASLFAAPLSAQATSDPIKRTPYD